MAALPASGADPTFVAVWGAAQRGADAATAALHDALIREIGRAHV